MIRYILAALLFALPVSAQELVNHTIDITDPVLEPTAPHVIARHYKLWDGRPNCGPGQTAPLLVAFHGGLGNAAKMANEYLTPPVINRCYVVAYPSGSNKFGQTIVVSGNLLLWNIYAPELDAGWPNAAGVNDDLFVASLVATLKAQYGLTKAFAVGVSLGGMLAFHQACDTATFDALATVATTIADPSCDIAYHIPNLHIHGTADTDVCWALTGSQCDPWPRARPLVLDYQASGGPHPARQIVSGGAHCWDLCVGYPTTAEIWAWLDGL